MLVQGPEGPHVTAPSSRRFQDNPYPHEPVPRRMRWILQDFVKGTGWELRLTTRSAFPSRSRYDPARARFRLTSQQTGSGGRPKGTGHQRELLFYLFYHVEIRSRRPMRCTERD